MIFRLFYKNSASVQLLTMIQGTTGRQGYTATNQGTTGRQGYTATNQGFSSLQSLAGQGYGGQQGYKFGQGGFAAGHGGYAASQGGYAAGQGGYAAVQGSYSLGQGGYAASQGQGSYAAGQSTLTGLQGYSGGVAGVRPAGTSKLDVFNLGGFQFGDFGGSTQVQAVPALAQTAAVVNDAPLGYAPAAAVPEISVGQVYGAGPVVQEPAVQAVYEASAVHPVLQHNEHHFQPGHEAVEQYNPLARGAVHAAAVPAVQAVPAVHASVQPAVHTVQPGRNQLEYNVLAFQNPHRARKPALGLEPRPVLETVAVAEERCIDKIEHVEETEYDEIEECHHSYDKKCHTSYSTEYSSQQEVECEDNYKKSCDITYSPSAHNETVHVCSRPLIKDCSLPGPPECRVQSLIRGLEQTCTYSP